MFSSAFLAAAHVRSPVFAASAFGVADWQVAPLIDPIQHAARELFPAPSALAEADAYFVSAGMESLWDAGIDPRIVRTLLLARGDDPTLFGPDSAAIIDLGYRYLPSIAPGQSLSPEQIDLARTRVQRHSIEREEDSDPLKRGLPILSPSIGAAVVSDAHATAALRAQSPRLAGSTLPESWTPEVADHQAQRLLDKALTVRGSAPSRVVMGDRMLHWDDYPDDIRLMVLTDRGPDDLPTTVIARFPVHDGDDGMGVPRSLATAGLTDVYRTLANDLISAVAAGAPMATFYRPFRAHMVLERFGLIAETLMWLLHAVREAGVVPAESAYAGMFAAAHNGFFDDCTDLSEPVAMTISRDWANAYPQSWGLLPPSLDSLPRTMRIDPAPDAQLVVHAVDRWLAVLVPQFHADDVSVEVARPGPDPTKYHLSVVVVTGRARLSVAALAPTVGAPSQEPRSSRIAHLRSGDDPASRIAMLVLQLAFAETLEPDDTRDRETIAAEHANLLELRRLTLV